MLADMGIDVWYPRIAKTVAAQSQVIEDAQQATAADLASLKSALADTATAAISNTPVAPAQTGGQAAVTTDAIVTPIHLHIVHNDTTLLLSQHAVGGPLKHFVADLLFSQQWRHGSESAAKTVISEFKWPVTDNPDTPERALRAFVDRYQLGSLQSRLLLCTAATLAELTAWITLPEQGYVLIPELPELMINADAKRVLWQRLSARL